MLARMSAAAANRTAHYAIAVEAAMAWRSQSDARQPPQLMALVRIKGVLSALKGTLGT